MGGDGPGLGVGVHSYQACTGELSEGLSNSGQLGLLGENQCQREGRGEGGRGEGRNGGRGMEGGKKTVDP